MTRIGIPYSLVVTAAKAYHPLNVYGMIRGSSKACADTTGEDGRSVQAVDWDLVFSGKHGTRPVQNVCVHPDSLIRKRTYPDHPRRAIFVCVILLAKFNVFAYLITVGPTNNGVLAPRVYAYLITVRRSDD